MELAMSKVDKEMEEAVKKHGKVTLPNNIEFGHFYDKINQNKETIARA